MNLYNLRISTQNRRSRKGLKRKWSLVNRMKIGGHSEMSIEYLEISLFMIDFPQ